MSRILLSLLLLTAGMGNLCSQTTFCLRLAVTTDNALELIVALEIQGSEAFNLGNSNLQFSFDNNALTNPTLHSHTLTRIPFPIYEIPTVTTPQPGEASFNIELNLPNFGDEISGLTGWTEVGQIRFEKTGMTQTEGMFWSYNGGTTETVLFLHDQATQIFATETGCLSGIAAGTLPVTLLSFTASPKNKTSVLHWETELEEENYGFFVEHSGDGKSFADIGFVEGKNQPDNYSFVDTKPSEGINYYRLRQTDFDGSFEYSGIRSVRFQNQPQILIYPNPSNGELNITYPDQPNSEDLFIYDVNGRLVHSEEAGVQKLDLSFLSNGLYLVVIGDQRFCLLIAK
ncbi:MAG: T9SS type A sorting domain-containing protein [Cyanobacteria bacterium J06649_11]